VHEQQLEQKDGAPHSAVHWTKQFACF